MAARGRQARLRRGGSRPAQGVNDRPREMPGEIRRLIEPTLAAARRVEWYRDNVVGARPHIGAALRHQRRQFRRERPPAVVFEGMDDRTQRAVVSAYRACERDDAPLAATPWAQRLSAIERPPGCERVAAAGAQRRRQRQDCLPAAAANRPLRRLVERLVARRARRGEQDAEDGVDGRRQSNP